MKIPIEIPKHGPLSELKSVWLLFNVAAHPVRLAVLFSAIPVLGLLFSIFFWESSFHRSGSLMVAIAVYAAYVNHHVSFEQTKSKEFLNATSHLNEKQKAKRQLAGKLNINDPQVEYMAQSIINTRNASAKTLPILQELKSNILKVEVSGGVLGTIIWGFGDLVVTLILRVVN